MFLNFKTKILSCLLNRILFSKLKIIFNYILYYIFKNIFYWSNHLQMIDTHIKKHHTSHHLLNACLLSTIDHYLCYNNERTITSNKITVHKSSVYIDECLKLDTHTCSLNYKENQLRLQSFVAEWGRVILTTMAFVQIIPIRFISLYMVVALSVAHVRVN